MAGKEATARIKINKLLEAAGWRFFPEGAGPANIRLESSVKIKTSDLEALGEDFEKTYRQKEVMGKVRVAVPGLVINQHDIRCVNRVYGVKKRAEYFYQGKVTGSPGQYSQGFVDWLIQRHHSDGEFFSKARAKAKAKA
jgi:hypothetical protein